MRRARASNGTDGRGGRAAGPGNGTFPGPTPQRGVARSGECGRLPAPSGRTGPRAGFTPAPTVGDSG